MAWGCNAMGAHLCRIGLILKMWIPRNISNLLPPLHKSHLTRCDDCTSLPGPRASACVPVKCWVPERERNRGWGDGAAGFRHVGVSVCAGVCQRCCWPAWGRRRSGRGGLHHGEAPAPGYSVQPREEQTGHEYLMCVCVRECVCSQSWQYESSHRARVDCEGTLDEVELQYAGLQGGVRRCDHLLLLLRLLLLLLPSALLFVRKHPQVVALCSPALERTSQSVRTMITQKHILYATGNVFSRKGRII